MRAQCGAKAVAVALLLLATGGAYAQASDPALEHRLGVEVDRFVAADRAAAPAHCQVLFVGSSTIVHWKDDLAGDMAPLPVINRGFGGSHIEYVNEWFDEIVAPYRPRAIVFYAGENDLDAGKPVQQVLADFDAFMQRKTQVLGQTPVYFLSVKPSKLRWSELPLQTQVNDAVRARAARRSDLHYLDLVSPMLEQGKLKDIFLADNLHMSRAGYELWIPIVRAALLPDTEAQAKSCRAADRS